MGLAHQSSCQEGALPLPATEGFDGLMGQGFQSEALQDGLLLLPMGGGVALPPAELREQARTHGLFDGDGKSAVDAAILRQIAEGKSRCALHASRHGWQEADHHFEQGGLSAAVLPTQHDEIAGMDIERKIAQDGATFVGDVDVLKRNEHHGR